MTNFLRYDIGAEATHHRKKFHSECICNNWYNINNTK